MTLVQCTPGRRSLHLVVHDLDAVLCGPEAASISVHESNAMPFGPKIAGSRSVSRAESLCESVCQHDAANSSAQQIAQESKKKSGHNLRPIIFAYTCFHSSNMSCVETPASVGCISASLQACCKREPQSKTNLEHLTSKSPWTKSVTVSGCSQ